MVVNVTSPGGEPTIWLNGHSIKQLLLTHYIHLLEEMTLNTVTLLTTVQGRESKRLAVLSHK